MKKIENTLWHVHEEVVGCQVDIVNNLSQVLVEVGVGQALQVVQ